jgi:hypothetical protein
MDSTIVKETRYVGYRVIPFTPAEGRVLSRYIYSEGQTIPTCMVDVEAAFRTVTITDSCGFSLVVFSGKAGKHSNEKEISCYCRCFVYRDRLDSRNKRLFMRLVDITT